MAGDAPLPRLLTRLARVAVASASVLVAACGGSSSVPESVDAARPGGGTTPTTRAPSSPRDARGGTEDASLRGALARASWARIRWPGGEVLEANRVDRLDEPVHAGSLFKLVVARAALAQGLLTPDTRVVCPRRVDVQGRRVDCVHPDLGRPLSLDDALAHSCNHFFVRVADRLDRRGLADNLRRLSGGSVVLGDDAPLPLVVLGLEGPRAGMRVWARVALAAMTTDPDDVAGSALVRRGVLRAAVEGTASALDDSTTLTMAKTGTTMPVGGGQEGRVVAWRPELGEAIVVRAPGVPSRDAALVARAAWDAAAEQGGARVRVGRVREAPAAEGQPRVDDLAIEAYVAGVVAAEGEREMPPVALQALAVAARSYAMAPGARHARDGFDVCDTTHCQVVGAATRWSREATARTRGVVLARGGAIVAVPYSASCSGVLSSPRDLWGGAGADLTRVGPEPAAHPVAAWQSEVTADALAAALRDAGHRGDVLRGVRVVARTKGGVPARVALDGLTPGEIDATTFRHVVGRRIGWDILKSHAWDVTRSGRGYRFAGQGKGHGAGLCLRGAATLAARGWPMSQVVSAYAPGTALRSMRDRIVLTVPATLNGAAPQLRAAILAALADLRVRLQVVATREVLVVVHPTAQAYQRATGRAWWTSASTRPLGADRHRIDLAPGAGPPGSTAALMSALRHELVHVLTAPVLSASPAWATEGLAHAAARVTVPPVESVGPPPSCPSDDEVTRPGSLVAMQDAYGRAASCVAAALPDGLDAWRALALR